MISPFCGFEPRIHPCTLTARRILRLFAPPSLTLSLSLARKQKTKEIQKLKLCLCTLFFLLPLLIAVTGENQHLHLCTDPIFSHLGLLQSPRKGPFFFPYQQFLLTPPLNLSYQHKILHAVIFSLCLFKIIIGPTSFVATAPLFPLYVYNKAPQRSCLYCLLLLCFYASLNSLQPNFHCHHAIKTISVSISGKC